MQTKCVDCDKPGRFGELYHDIGPSAHGNDETCNDCEAIRDMTALAEAA